MVKHLAMKDVDGFFEGLAEGDAVGLTVGVEDIGASDIGAAEVELEGFFDGVDEFCCNHDDDDCQKRLFMHISESGLLWK